MKIAPRNLAEELDILTRNHRRLRHDFEKYGERVEMMFLCSVVMWGIMITYMFLSP